MNQKQRSKLLEAIVETVQNSLKPNINAISEKLGINANQMEKITTQLDRIEHKIDLLLNSQASTSTWPIPKKKIFKS